MQDHFFSSLLSPLVDREPDVTNYIDKIDKLRRNNILNFVDLTTTTDFFVLIPFFAIINVFDAILSKNLRQKTV